MNKQAELTWIINNHDLKSLQKILKNKKLDPTYNNNEAIRQANNYGYSDMVKILLKKNSVKQSLKKDIPELYHFLMEEAIIDKINNF
jgi:hypothetical protein